MQIFSALNIDFNGPSLDFLGSRKPAHKGIKEQYPCKSRNVTVLGQSFVKTSADRHAAYHNKQQWRVFQLYYHRWLWKNLSFQNKRFLLTFAIFGWSVHSNNYEQRQNGWRQTDSMRTGTALSCILWALAQISCTNKMFLIWWVYIAQSPSQPKNVFKNKHLPLWDHTSTAHQPEIYSDEFLLANQLLCKSCSDWKTTKHHIEHPSLNQ